MFTLQVIDSRQIHYHCCKVKTKIVFSFIASQLRLLTPENLSGTVNEEIIIFLGETTVRGHSGPLTFRNVNYGYDNLVRLFSVQEFRKCS